MRWRAPNSSWHGCKAPRSRTEEGIGERDLQVFASAVDASMRPCMAYSGLLRLWYTMSKTPLFVERAVDEPVDDAVIDRRRARRGAARGEKTCSLIKPNLFVHAGGRSLLLVTGASEIE